MSCPSLQRPWVRHRPGLRLPHSPQSGEVERKKFDRYEVDSSTCGEKEVLPYPTRPTPNIASKGPKITFWLNLTKRFKMLRSCSNICFQWISHKKINNIQIHYFTWLWQFENTAQNMSHLLPLYLRRIRYQGLKIINRNRSSLHWRPQGYHFCFFTQPDVTVSKQSHRITSMVMQLKTIHHICRQNQLQHSFKFFHWGEFFTMNAKTPPDRIEYPVWCCTSVSFYTQWVILHTVCNFKHSVLFYAQCVIYTQCVISTPKYQFTLFCRETVFSANLRTFECKIFRPWNMLV